MNESAARLYSDFSDARGFRNKYITRDSARFIARNTTPRGLASPAHRVSDGTHVILIHQQYYEVFTRVRGCTCFLTCYIAPTNPFHAHFPTATPYLLMHFQPTYLPTYYLYTPSAIT